MYFLHGHKDKKKKRLKILEQQLYLMFLNKKLTPRKMKPKAENISTKYFSVFLAAVLGFVNAKKN